MELKDNLIQNHDLRQFILASSSAYKKAVLSKLNIPFRTFSPDIDETPLTDETAEKLVARLSNEKALKACESDDAINKDAERYYIGVDQVAVFRNKIIGKSHTIENAIAQLSSFSGSTVTFLTGISLCNHLGKVLTHVEPYQVTFKSLTQRQIEQYVHSERPLDCAGSFKCEGQGILLFESMEGRDINSLVGMPLIAFQELCLRFDVDLFELL